MNLLGIAIIGKSNEPLYLCDCTKILQDASEEASAVESSDDIFGFLQASRARGQRESLPLEQQFMIHSALDRLEEMIGISNSEGTMPLRVSINGMAARSTHWLGRLTEIDGNSIVYGYVTATNIKFLCLCQLPCKASLVKVLLTNLHVHYTAYIMNPFSKLRGPIDSRRFDENFKKVVKQYQEQISSA